MSSTAGAGLVDARALWWTEPQTCTCGNVEEDRCTHDAGGWPSPLYDCTIDGAQYLTDRYVFLPTARLGGLPVGYGKLLMPLYPQAEAALAEWLTATVSPDPSDRVFSRCIIDPIEAAGLLLRPLEGVKEAHGICDPDLTLVGLATPVRHHKVAGADPDQIRTAAL